MPYPITGIQAGRGPNGELPIRREIDEWWFSPELNDVYQRSLFVYALKNFQAQGFDKNDDLSYLNIAGIHGLPLKEWPRNGKETKHWYCAHGRVTFATWHTPYMLLFEQRLYEEMKKLIPTTFAAKYHDAMNEAADTWRLPFWDWAMKKPTWNPDNQDDPANKTPGTGPNVPFVVTQVNVPVLTSIGDATLVKNPLFNYALKEGSSFGDYGVTDAKSVWYADCRVTSRQPTLPDDMDEEEWTVYPADKKKEYTEGLTQDYRKITSQLQGVVSARNRNTGHLKYFANSFPDAVYRLLKPDKQGNPGMPYKSFSTGSYNNGQRVLDYPSLEGIHNNIHNFAGGNGYLGDPATAAFDPLFWLHHCNIDRLLSMWQDLYTPQTNEWLKTDDPDEGPQVELRPFPDAEGNLFTSRTCTFKHQKFGYTYPELKKWQFTKDGQFDEVAYIDSIIKEIERLYSTTAKAALLLKSNETVAKKQMAAMTAENIKVENFPAPLLDMVPAPVLDGAQNPLGDVTAIPEESFGDPESTSWKSNDYVANVVYERFALGGRPYSITLFLGDVPAHSAYDFGEDVTAVGRVYNFSSTVEGRGTDETGCENCKKQQEEGALFSGQVILTDYLIERVMLAEEQRGLTLTSLNRDEVVEYLKKNLHWRITDLHHKVIPKETMPALKISVAMAEGTHYSEANKPSHYSEYTMLWDATQGRLAGAAPGDI